MYYKKLSIITIIIIFVILVVIKSFNTNSIIEVNNLFFLEYVTQKNEEKIILNNFSAFEWEQLFLFKPYSSTDYIENVIGLKSNLIKTTYSEGMNNLIFMNDDKIVSIINGYPEDMGVWFDISDFDDYIKITEQDNVILILNPENSYSKVTFKF